MSRKCADGVHKVCASSAQVVRIICTNCAHAVAHLNPPSTDKRIFFRNKSFYTTFRYNYFVKKRHLLPLLPPTATPEAL